MKELPPGRTGAARRHMRWAVPLLIGVVGFPVLGALGSQLSANARGTTNIAGSLGGLLLMLLAFVTAIVAAVFFVVGVVRTLSEWRRVRRHAAGKFTQAELEDRARAEAFASSWQNARQLHATLAHRQVPAQIQVWDVVPNAGEAFFYDTSASYARFYGQDVAYNRSGGFFFGHPLFVVAGVALSAAGNAARRSSAEAAAAAQWREHQDRPAPGVESAPRLQRRRSVAELLLRSHDSGLPGGRPLGAGVPVRLHHAAAVARPCSARGRAGHRPHDARARSDPAASEPRSARSLTGHDSSIGPSTSPSQAPPVMWWR